MLGFLLYQSNYLQILVRVLRSRRTPPAPTFPDGCPDAMLVLPTLLTRDAELEGLKGAIRSATRNGYPGGLVVCAAIDHASGSPDLLRRLEAWVAGLSLPAGTEVLVTPTAARVGKAMAIETAVHAVRRQVDAGARRWPTVFFSMDADSEVTPGSLAR